MGLALVSAVALGIVVLLGPATLTALGARRRGRGLAAAFAAGFFFPATWFIWYLLDEHPYKRRPQLTNERAVRRAWP